MTPHHIAVNSRALIPLSLVLLMALIPLHTVQGAEQMAFSEIEQQRGLPSRGQTSNTVIKNHGEPTSKQTPVGTPPIKSWQYSKFTVYFERDLVITTIANEDQLPEKLKGIVQN